MSENTKKRKQTADNTPAAKRPRLPPKPRNKIPTTPTSTAYPNGEISVRNFLKSHEHEIRSLETAMQAAKKGLSRRAFQNVPRDLRRRTASHNPQRVPKRLRIQAKREAREDKTPVSRGKSGSGVGKGRKAWLRKEGIEKSRKQWERMKTRRTKDVNVAVEPMEGVEMEKTTSETASAQPTNPKTKRQKFSALAKPDTPSSRFRRRQKNKTWLPTHLWHTKRARMTTPNDPLWRFAIPLAPVVKSYRLTHRAAGLRGAVGWDMSYMATIGLEGVEASISGLLKGLHFAEEDDEDPWQDRGRGKKWKAGTRVWEGWIYERECKPHRPIARATIIWSVADTEGSKRKVFLRVHPGAFLQLWEQLIRISKVQKPAVAVEDLRFEIGSIEIMGPAAAESLCSVLTPSPALDPTADAAHAIWPSLAAITSLEVMPSGALLGFLIQDPRLKDPPATTQIRQDPESQSVLLSSLAAWPLDSTQETPAIFNRACRLAAGRSLPSQKSINRRESANTLGGYPEPRSTDPNIPMLTYTSRNSRTWTVLLPWKCVSSIWRGLMRYPVSTGGNPRFGGLKERRQVDFERSMPAFPFDHPGTDAGWGWELQQRAARKQDWTKRPKGKRIEWLTIDLGNGKKGELGDPWACGWEMLLPKKQDKPGKDADGMEHAQSSFRQVFVQDTAELLSGCVTTADDLAFPVLFSVKISMAQRGTPTTCARIYRLPTNNPELRRRWLCLMQKPGAAASTKRTLEKPQHPNKASLPKHLRHQHLAQKILEPPQIGDGPPKAGDEDYPRVPDEEDLIGFVTTGNYNLAEGMPTAVANLALHRVLERREAKPHGRSLGREERVCIVREAGRTIGRLATWEVA